MNDDKKLAMQYISSRNISNVQLSTSSSRTSNSVNKGSETTKPPAFQFISPDELISLYEQRKGCQYFIPEGFEPVLIPRGSPLQPVANLLQSNKHLHQQLLIQKQQLKIQANQNAAAPDVVVVNNNKPNNSSIIPPISNQQNSSSSDVRFPKLVLARSAAPTPPRGSGAKAQKPKKPPRPPNAFILYRRSKQPDIVARNEGISNNEVSKQVGEMWHKEPIEEKMKFQRLADAAKMEHMKKYPEYKYRPRRPHEKRRRTKRPSTSLTANNSVPKSSSNDNVETTTTSNANNNDCIGNMETSPLLNSISNNELSFLQQSQQVDRRSSIDTVSSIDYYDESRRSSLISCGDMNELDYNNNDFNDYDQLTLFDDVNPLVDEPNTIQYPVSSSCTSNSPQEFCVENTAAFDLMMEGVSPGNDSDVNPYNFFSNFGYPEYMQFNNGTFDLNSLMTSQNDQMMSCAANIDA